MLTDVLGNLASKASHGHNYYLRKKEHDVMSFEYSPSWNEVIFT